MNSSIKVAAGVSILGLIGSGLSFLAQLALARTFGTGSEIDAYFVGNSLPALVGGLLAGAISYQVIPLLVRSRTGRQPFGDIQDALLQWAFFVGAMIFVIGSIVSFVLMFYYPNSESYFRHSAHWVAVIGWLGSWNGLLLGLLSALCQADSRFFRATLVTYLPSLFTLAACGLIANYGGTILHVAVGILIAQLIGTVLIGHSVRGRLNVWRRLNQVGREMRHEMNALPMVLLSTLVFTCFPAADAFWGSYIGAGAVGMLAYGQRVVVALAGLAVSGASIVAAPRFAAIAALADEDAFRTDVMRVVRLVLLTLSPMAVIVGVLAEPTIKVLFEGGRFNSEDVRQLSNLVSYFVAGMMPMSGSVILFRAHYARNDIRGAAAIGGIGMALYSTLSGFAVQERWGLSGVGVAYIISWTTVFSASLWRIWRARLGFRNIAGALVWTSRVLLVALCIGLSAGLLRRYIGGIEVSRQIRLGELVLTYGALIVCFVGGAYAIGVSEVQQVVRAGFAALLRHLAIRNG